MVPNVSGITEVPAVIRLPRQTTGKSPFACRALPMAAKAGIWAPAGNAALSDVRPTFDYTLALCPTFGQTPRSACAQRTE